MEKNNNTSVECGGKMTIEDYIHIIRERLTRLPLIIQTALNYNKQFNEEYYDCNVSMQPASSIINGDYIFYDVFARYRPGSQVVYLDNIWLSWKQIDDDAEILKEVKKFIGRVCKEASE